LTNACSGGGASIGQPVDARVCFHALDTWPGIPIDQEAAPDQPVAERAGFEREVSVGDLPIVARRQEQILAALPTVWTGIAKVGHVVEECVVDKTECVRRTLDDHGPVPKIKPCQGVDTLGIGRQKQRFRVHKVFEDAYGPIDQAHALHALAHGIQGGYWQGIEKCSNASLEVQIVIGGVYRGGIGVAVEELERTNAVIDRAWCQDRIGYRCVADFAGLCAGRSARAIVAIDASRNDQQRRHKGQED
jgi:hypothetical protein